MQRINVIEADITTLDVDAIVNAANTALLGGGGVDGAIHSAAGPELLAECQGLHGCATGNAKITKGYQLPARHVIHAVGPVWRGGDACEDVDLASCYQRALEVAQENGIKTVAFPAISTGNYGYPPERAAQIAVQTVIRFLERHAVPEAVTFCCYDGEFVALHQQALADAQKPC